MRAKFNECDVDHNGLVSLGEAKAVLMKPPFNFPEEKVTLVITSAKDDMSSPLFVCLSVCLLATLRKNFRTDLHEIFRVGCQWANEQMIKF